MDVLITGLGCISPIGNDADENLKSLRSSYSGIKKVEIFESKYTKNLLFGEVKYTNKELINLCKIADYKGLTRTDLLSIYAFLQATSDAGLSNAVIASDETAFISASTVGGMCLTNQLYDDSNLRSATTEFLDSYSCASHTLQIVKRFGIKGVSNTINTACSSSANAIMYGARLIKSGLAKRAIVGGVDSLSKYTVNGFNSLQIFSKNLCKPFDQYRDGLNLGEAAAYLVLESESEINRKKAYAKIIGYGNSNDAFHASAMSDNATGVTAAIRWALKSADLQTHEIDYINAHGTGTQNNDLVELFGFRDVFQQIPPFSSTKSFTGHTLGAAGAIEAVFSIFSLLYNELYPNLNFETPISDFGISPVKSVISGFNLRNVMSNSYGFNGNCTSLIFQKL